jgi:cyclopropane fatty-acyl-phospholipid synthase-like methyltransferase
MESATDARYVASTRNCPASLCEVGCGAGGVLAALRSFYPRCKLSGYDIAPDAARFWPQHVESDIEFRVGDFLEINEQVYDVLLLLDVIEHLENPFEFLSRLHGAAAYFLFIIPLDLSALSVLREKPLLNQRRNVGHIHYFTKNLALSLLRECGYEIKSWHYSGAAFHAPKRTWRTRLASFPRRIAYFLNKDWGVRALGGETLIVLASSVPGALQK